MKLKTPPRYKNLGGIKEKKCYKYNKKHREVLFDGQTYPKESGR